MQLSTLPTTITLRFALNMKEEAVIEVTLRLMIFTSKILGIVLNISRAKTTLLAPISLEKTTNAIVLMNTPVETVLKRLSHASQIHVLIMVHA